MDTTRRRLLIAGASVAASAWLAGCTGSGQNGVEPPDPDTDPRELLPPAPDGWEADEPNQQMAGMVGAEAGYGRSYEDPEGTHYSVEILRWSSEDQARTGGRSVYEDSWAVYTTLGNFGFAGNGPDVDLVHGLLDESPGLPEGYSRENNLFG